MIVGLAILAASGWAVALISMSGMIVIGGMRDRWAE